MQNLSCENEFYLHDKVSQERFCAWPGFKTEACAISEMAYYKQRCYFKVYFDRSGQFPKTFGTLQTTLYSQDRHN